MELMFAFDPKDTRHLYEQIYVYLRDEIRSGSLRPGERLPSTRRLAASLKIARTTVELAYEQLEEEGYLVIRRGSGAYVCETTNIPNLAGAEEAEHRSRPDAAGKPGETSEPESSPAKAFAGEDSVWREGKTPKPLAAEEEAEIDFSLRTIDMSAFPYATWRRILRGILTGDRSELFRRGDPGGDFELRETIARYLHLSRGCRCRPEQIVIGAGNDYLLMVLAMVLEDHDGKDAVAMDACTYLRAAEVLRGMGYEVRPVSGDEQGMSRRALEKSGARLAYVMPARQFPTGQVMPYPRRAELLSWAAAGRNRYLIEDDYDSEFKYRGRPVPSLQSADENGHVIYMGTFSKSIAPAIRISYLILPERLLPVFREKAGFLSCTVPRLDQAVLNEFIGDGYFERYLNRMRNRYKGKHDLMLELLQPMKKHFVITGQGAGLHLVLQPKEAGCAAKGAAEQELIERAKRQGVRVYGLSEQCLPEAGQPADTAILLGYAALTEEEMREGAARLCRAWAR